MVKILIAISCFRKNLKQLTKMYNNYNLWLRNGRGQGVGKTSCGISVLFLFDV